MAKVEATTQADTRRYMIEDGLNPDNPLAGFTPISKIVEVRRKADMSQDAFARALHVPVKTIRNWEQGRSKPDPAARTLLAIVEDNPAQTFATIKRRMTSIADYADGKGASYPKARGRMGEGSKSVRDAADAAGKAISDAADAALRKL